MPTEDRPPHDWLRRFIAERTGNASLDRSDAAIDARLQSVLRNQKLDGLPDLVRRLGRQPPAKLVDAVVAALMNNETSFFRDGHCFDALAEHVLPRLIEMRRRTRTLNLWSAACSTGQEPVSLVILLHELMGPKLRDWTVQVTASDVSSDAVERTRRGRFSTLEIRRGLSDARRTRYFTPDRDAWQFDRDLHRLIKSQQINLVEAWPMLPRMDLILLRNMLIYVGPTERKTLLGRLAAQLKPDGGLVLGAPETLIDTPPFVREIHDRLRVYRVAPPS